MDSISSNVPQDNSSTMQSKRPQGRPRRIDGICTKCGETDPTKFYCNRTTGRKLPKCKACCNKKTPEEIKKNNIVSADKHKAWHEARPDYYRTWYLKDEYGLTPTEYQEMLKSQHGVCKICGNAPSKGKKLHIDHCHKTGAVRGLLCHGCNVKLGWYSDDPVQLCQKAEELEQLAKFVRKSAEYLK